MTFGGPFALIACASIPAMIASTALVRIFLN
jgi:hypothetical protein